MINAAPLISIGVVVQFARAAFAVMGQAARILRAVYRSRLCRRRVFVGTEAERPRNGLPRGSQPRRDPEEVGLAGAVGLGRRVQHLHHLDRLLARAPALRLVEAPAPELAGLVLGDELRAALADQALLAEALDEDAAHLDVGLGVDRLDGD